MVTVAVIALVACRREAELPALLDQTTRAATTRLPCSPVPLYLENPLQAP